MSLAEQTCWYCNQHLSNCMCAPDGNKETVFKHGDKVSLVLGQTAYDGHIEERMLNQYPDKRSDLFVVVDNLEVPKFPISIDKFKKDYGKIYLKAQ